MMQNRWLGSPQTTHQRFALKWLPHSKCNAKIWSIICISPSLVPNEAFFSKLRWATKWAKFEVCAIFCQWVIKCFWGISSMRMHYNVLYIWYCFTSGLYYMHDILSPLQVLLILQHAYAVYTYIYVRMYIAMYVCMYVCTYVFTCAE